MRKLSAVLALLLLLTSCGQAAAGSGEAAPQTEAQEAAPETTTEDPNADSLPEADLEGAEFRIWARGEEALGYIFVSEMNGDVINDAVYTAVNNVSERFNVNITGTVYECEINTSNNKIGTAILAGDDFCEIISCHDRTVAQWSLAGMLSNVNDLPHLDYSKPWWPSKTLETLTVNGIMYIISNSLSYGGIRGTSCTYFNKDRLDSYGIEYPYQTVRDGGWTLDLMTELCKDVYEDVNGDGQRDREDNYGFVAIQSAYRIVESFEIVPYRADPDKILIVDVDNDRSRQLFDKYYRLCFESAGGVMYPEDASYREMFNDGKAMFTFGTLGDSASTFRYSDIKYGFLPMPKLNDMQDDYCCGNNDVPFCVPITNTKSELTGLMIEALSAEGYRVVQPAYFEIALKQKFTSDEDSVEMLDIIAQNRVLDFGYLYCGWLPLCRFISFMFDPKKPNKDFDSFYAKNIQKEQANVDSIIEAYTVS